MPAVETKNSDIEKVARLKSSVDNVKSEIAKAIVGQDEVVHNTLICVLTGGHAILVGVPGLAKTLLVRVMGQVMDLSFSRIQFTPDLMPSDITGTDIIQEDPETGRRRMEFIRGPLFANIVLADEINRTPPKTQAALLEAMQEHKVTAGGTRHSLPHPFFVLATQNPIEQEGTYPLPEAQLDRFMFMLQVGYPSKSEEIQILRTTTGEAGDEPRKAITAAEIVEYQEVVRRVPVPDHVFDFAASLVRRTRPSDPEAPLHVREWVTWGAGPRAGQHLILGAKANAILSGNLLVGVDDIKAVARPVLCHRVLTNFHAEAEGITSSVVVDRILEEV